MYKQTRSKTWQKITYASLRLKNIRSAAVVVINNQTHQVVSLYYGSAGFADTLDGGQVNGAAAIRQPGST